MTGSVQKMNIVGRKGQTLNDAWAAGPVTYLGLGVPGYPNLFNIAGAGSPSVLANMVLHAELHVIGSPTPSGIWVSTALSRSRLVPMRRPTGSRNAPGSGI